MKRLITILLSFLAVHLAFAEKVQIDDLYYNLNEADKTAEVTYGIDSKPDYYTPAYTNLPSTLEIPASVYYNGKQYTVTSIGTKAFFECRGLTSIALPESLVSIGFGAFDCCTGLTSIALPESLTSIGISAFCNCSGLTSITFPESLTSIGDEAFSSTNLSSVVFPVPESSISIGANAFHNCNSLGEVKVPSLEAWFKIRFNNYYSNPNCFAQNLIIDGKELSGVVELPKDWTEVPVAQFLGCDAVTEFIWPENLTSIGDCAFRACRGLTSIALPENLVSIGKEAFGYCKYLTSITIPESVTSISSNTFIQCISLTSITFPESLTSIENSAFMYCEGLTSITFPKSLISIGENAFYRCTGLIKVVALNNTPAKINTSAFENPIEREGILYVPQDALEAYKNADNWKNFLNIQPIVLPSEISITGSSNSLTAGEEMPLTVTVNPDNVTVDQFNWSSSNPEIATVSLAGIVTALKEGEVTITAKTIDGSNLEDTFNIKVIGYSESASPENLSSPDFDISIDESLSIPVHLNNKSSVKYSGLQFDVTLPEGLQMEEVTLGEQLAGEAFVLTSSAQENNTTRVLVTPTTNLDGVEFTQNLVYLKVKATTAARLGTDKILFTKAYLSTVDGSDIFLDDSSTSVTVVGTMQVIGEKNVIKTTEELQLSAVFAENPEESLNVTWSSSAPEYAKVDAESGLVTGVAAGNATITATLNGNEDVKASFEVEVQPLLLGDANDNGLVSVSDVVTIANFIAKKTVANWCFVNADVTKDKAITCSDITGTIEIISGNVPVSSTSSRRNEKAAQTDRLVSDNFNPMEGETFDIAVRLDNSKDYSALQASVIIPDGMTVEGVTAGSRSAAHNMVYNITEEGTVEVVLFSFDNSSFARNDQPLFNLHVSARRDCGDLMIERIIASDPTATDHVLSYAGGRNEGVSTGIDGISDGQPGVRTYSEGIEVINAEGSRISIYAVTGEVMASVSATSSVMQFPLGSGIYIVTVGDKVFKVKL